MSCDQCGARRKSNSDTARCDDCLLEAQIALREESIGTGLCATCEGPCDLDKGLCDACRSPRGSRSVEASNPYKKVWNSVEDEEKFILDSVRNNALFIPTPAILADRHRASARHWRRQATKLGTVAGRTALKEAEFHDRMAASSERYGEAINEKKRPRSFTFTVVKDN